MRRLLYMASAATLTLLSLTVAADDKFAFDGFGGNYKHFEQESKTVYTLTVDGDKATLEGKGLSAKQTKNLKFEVFNNGRSAFLKDTDGNKITGFGPQSGSYTYGAIFTYGFSKGYGITSGFWEKAKAAGSTDSWSDSGSLKEGVYEPIGFNEKYKRMQIGNDAPGSVSGTFLNMSDSGNDEKLNFGFEGKIENEKLYLTETYFNTQLKKRQGVTVTFDMSDPKKLTCLDCKQKVDPSFPEVWVFAKPFDKKGS